MSTTSILPSSLMGLVTRHPEFGPIVDEYVADWAPDPVPLTGVLSEIGRAFVASADLLRLGDVTDVFDRIELMLTRATHEEKEAASTGFLEAVAAALDEAPDRLWILDHAGPAARAFLDAWDGFCGVVR